jgi:biotin carboxylase
MTFPSSFRTAELVCDAGYAHSRINLRYRLDKVTANSSQFYTAVDVILDFRSTIAQHGAYLSTVEEKDAFICEQDTHSRIQQFHPAVTLIKNACSNSTQGSEVGIKLLLPSRSGFVCRPDILEERMLGCEHVTIAAGFISSTEQHLEPCGNLESFHSILLSACGGFVADTRNSLNVQTTLSRLSEEVDARFSFNSILDHTLYRKRLALIQARKEFSTIERFYMAARALNVDLIAVDSPGHWLQSEHGPSTSLRDHFIPFDMTVDDSLSQRLYEALKDLRLDGIISSNDRHLVAVAEAAELLGLPTMPSSALEVSTDKHATRVAEEGSEGSSVLINSLADLDELLQGSDVQKRQFPLIVKPCLGWSSDCVARVTNVDELRDAVERASTKHRNSFSTNTAVVIEPYIDGPEVDTNIVLMDGECLYFEVSDDFPSTGDIPGASASNGNFQETQIVYPTALPESEQIVLRDGIHNSLLRLGFHTGVFHVEARVRDSAVQYTTDAEGIPDLGTVGPGNESKPSCWLLEINARPPGGLSDWATAYANGICLHALAILAAIGDKQRYRALATPFKQSVERCCPQPQFQCMLTYVSPERAGVLVNSPCEDLQQRGASLLRNALRYCCWYKQGDHLSGPQDTNLGWLATYLLFVRQTDSPRRDLLRLGNQLKEEIRVEVE